MTLTREQHASLVAEAVEHLGMVPAHLAPGLSRYLVFGIEPGGLLCAVIENNLNRAIVRVQGRPDDAFDELRALTRWLYNHAPGQCWGSKEKRLAWQRDVAALVRPEAQADA